jgi:predicted GIY-YIG superfamily endonuclease
MAGATIKIYLADGTPLGLRVLEKSNWTGKGYDFARVEWPKVRLRADFGRPGVYVLRGLDDDGEMHIYIGEADELRTRINQHYAGPGAKEFWERAVAFTSKDENLNKAHVRYLESRLVALAHAAKNAQIENSNLPSAPSLSESDRDEAETFLAEMLVIYPLLEIKAFVPPPVKIDAVSVLYLKGKGIEAQGRDAPEGFVVYEGSHAVKSETEALHVHFRKLRAKLISDAVLVDDGASLRLTQGYTFNKPSTAAAVLLARSANGRTEWKDASGKTLKAIQESTAG